MLGLTVWAGTETGLLKEVFLPAEASRDLQGTLVPNVANAIRTTTIGQVDPKAAVQQLAWIHADESTFDPASDKIAAARKNGTIDLYGIAEQEKIWAPEECFEGFEAPFIGLEARKQHIFASTSNGSLSKIPVFDESLEVESWNFETMALSAVAFAPSSEHLVATVGTEQLLTLWDLRVSHEESDVGAPRAKKRKPSDPTPIKQFEAKAPAHDHLDLRVPQCLTTVRFIDASPHLLATTSSTGQLALYDTRVKRRPVQTFQVSSHSIGVSSVLRPSQLWVADAGGSAQLFDLKAGRSLGKLKGNIGITQALASTADGRWVVSTGVDRFVRVHDAITRRMVHSHYIKSKCTQLLVDDFTFAAHEADVAAMEDADWQQLDVLDEDKRH